MLLGSGLRFPAFIGALSAIEEKGLKVKKVIGASAGSIIGSLYASGRTPMEMKKLALALDTSAFRDWSVGSLLGGKGFYRGNAAEKYIDTLLKGRTFSEGFNIPLYVIATDMVSSTPFVFSGKNFPGMKVSEAIRYSIGIPLVFAYKRFKHKGKNHIFVDGNLLSGVIEDMFTDEGNLLILRVVSRRSREQPLSDKFSFGRYLRGLLLILLHAVEKERIKGSRWHDTILISCGDIPPTKFVISQDEKAYLIEQGYTQVKQYLEYKWGI